MFNKNIKRGLKIIVSAVFLFWVIFKVDWLNVWISLQSIKLSYLLAYIGTVFLGILICSYRWKLLANYKKIQSSFWNFIRYYLAGTFVNNFMPSFIGGDTFKSYETGKLQGKYVEAVSAVMMDRIIGLLGAMILALFFSLVNINQIKNNWILMLTNGAVGIFLIVLIFSVKFKKPFFWFLRGKYLPQKIKQVIENLKDYSDQSILMRTFLLTFLFDFVGVALANYILFSALGIKIGIINYLSIIFIISIVASVPISINNIGIKEWAYVTFFGAFGLTASSVVTVAIISRFIQMLISFVALPVYLKRAKRDPETSSG
jgi:uncharacterized protein (TIRG00374 family)